MKIIHVDVDNAFWKYEMLPLLTRFYYQCMLPEIVDSRHNRHMPIRDPSYIIEAKQEAAKKINTRKSKWQNVINSENVNKEKKRFKSDISPTETAITATAAENIEQDDDCIIVSTSAKQNITKDDMARHKKILDNVIPSLSIVKGNVLPINSKINDKSLDLFLRVIRETFYFETQNVLYLEFPHIITASCSDKSIQIIGGNCSDHWRCIFFDGTKLHVYEFTWLYIR